MTYRYERLTARDVARFRELLAVLGEAFEDPAAYTGAQPDDAYLARLLDKSDFIALAAVDHDRVVAGLAAYVLEKFEQDRREIYIYDIAVLESHRRRGVATGLINELKPIARQVGAFVIFVQADQGDTPAIKLYESLGTREDVHHFDIDVR